MLKTRKRRKVPWPVTCALPFIPHKPLSWEWERVLHKLAWQPKKVITDSALIDLYHDGVADILWQEALAN